MNLAEVTGDKTHSLLITEPIQNRTTITKHVLFFFFYNTLSQKWTALTQTFFQLLSCTFVSLSCTSNTVIACYGLN